ncbi:MAG: DNA phosphorothioation-dependent restriction protein DptF, partial [Algicola sp.]|nr:DNA phosphorothioation-dependent restriction protein DptF [Algicola sp.]
LVIGINVGMLGNYAEEGSNAVIKASIKAFLNKQPLPGNHKYLDFENYPKFRLETHGHTAEFAKQLLQRITAKENNIIRQYFDKEQQADTLEKRVCSNYELLSVESVQDVIIDVLFKARLMKDQFLTARALLDFVYHLLTGPDDLFDNLFTAGENELAARIAEFDPANIRSKLTDDFILSHSLHLADDAFDEYKMGLKQWGLDVSANTTATSYLRLFYIMRNEPIANNYHAKFSNEFDEKLIEHYSTIWHLHKGFDGASEQRSALRKFYRDTAIAAIHKYNNRNATCLEKDEFYISEHNGLLLATTLDLKVDFAGIQKHKEVVVSHFKACFKIGEEKISLSVNINLLNLMLRIVAGYRPNKHDKNTVMLLDEVVDKIAEVANRANVLHIFNNKKRIKVTNVDDEDFEVSGI